MLGDARLAAEFADDMLKQGIYVIGFSFPVVPKGKHAHEGKPAHKEIKNVVCDITCHDLWLMFGIIHLYACHN